MQQQLMETHRQPERIDRILGSMGEKAMAASLDRQSPSATERCVARSTAKSAA
jgi:hypothetical protein